jgi:hypothetical protein
MINLEHVTLETELIIAFISFYLTSVIATTVTLGQVITFNTSFLESFCPKA